MRGGLRLVAALVFAGFMFAPRRAVSMTSVAEQDTSDVPREADANAQIAFPELPPPWSSGASSAPAGPGGSTSIENQAGGEPATYTTWDEWGNLVVIDVATGAEVGPADTPAAKPWWEGQYPAFEGGYPVTDIPATPDTRDALEAQLTAFLYMLRCCEHVYPRDVLGGQCYHLMFSGESDYPPAAPYLNQRFYDMTDHPVITGECHAVPLSPRLCSGAGLHAGCVSTAAGAYQIIKPIWMKLQAGHPDLLPDFSMASQDRAALLLLDQLGARAALEAGDWPKAVALAAGTWASLPGSTARQGPKDRAFALARFNEGLGAA